MDKYVWKKELETGIAEIDEQHVHMTEMVNNFQELDAAKMNRDNVLDVFNDLISYAHSHFTVEEEYLRKSQYPEAKEHIEEHQKLLARVNELFFDFSEDNIPKSVKDISVFLQEWMDEHLLKIDKKFADYYLNKDTK
ncbi:hypothetical protein C0584_04175 [Candidatus Parcubacteria bacterium]|nr:MAG: hypothetical protein C0584_04175 [Candidatus Parcubacteria bacterium]